jgi:hypothetical protein
MTKQVLPGREEGLGEETGSGVQQGEMAQTMYAHVSK